MRSTRNNLIRIFTSLAECSRGQQIDGLIALATLARIMREHELLDLIIRQLRELNLTSTQFETLQYFSAYSDIVRGDASPVVMLENLSSLASAPIRARAFHVLGLVECFINKQAPKALRYYHESLRSLSENDTLSTLRIQKDIAVCLALDGDHKSSLRLLEEIRPMEMKLKTALPIRYLDFLNSYAIELAHAGRFEEADHASRIVVASIDPGKFPEWHDTRFEIAEMRQRKPSSQRIKIELPPTEKPSEPARVIELKPLIEAREIDREWKAILRLTAVRTNRTLLRLRTARMVIDRNETTEDDVVTVKSGLDSLIESRSQMPAKKTRKIKQKRAK